MSQLPDSERLALLQYREFLENARLAASRDRDKLVLAVAAGSLTVSVTLLQTMANRIDGPQVGLMIVGWACEVVAIILVLYSLAASEHALSLERRRVDVMLVDGKDPNWANADKARTLRLNTWASWLAVIGISCILVQAGIGVRLLSP